MERQSNEEEITRGGTMPNAQDLVTKAVTQLAQTYQGRNNIRQYWDFLNRNAGVYVGYRNGEFGYDAEMQKVHTELGGDGVQINLRRRYDKDRLKLADRSTVTPAEFDHILNTTQLCIAYMLRSVYERQKQSHLVQFIDELDRNIGKQVITIGEGISALEAKISQLTRAN